MKIRNLLSIAALLSSNAFASDTLETIKDTFSVSFGSETTATLNASYDLSEDWRVFGEVDSEGYWEAGVGYNFIIGNIYNEVTFYAADGLDKAKPWVGYFAAGYLAEDLVMYGSVDVGYGKFARSASGDLIDIDVTNNHFNMDATVGLMYDITDWFALGYEFSHYNRYDINELSINDRYKSDKGLNHVVHSHEVSATFNIKGVKPTVSYHFYEDSDLNFAEVGLYFDF
ncbi:hypothetical protein BCV08_16635 [Vibrio breoganii]|uniref:hypothetical protein n=1 Tax=Vibrio breoganii TaxID=553239 RepID=UPI000C8182FB|nr:hypothetical protein [Vibrio breoganii]PMF77606.1 hypothetical protein BCV08_16635 [Vibrio breoganii]